MQIVGCGDYAAMFRPSVSYPRLEDHDVVIDRGTGKDPGKIVACLTEADVAVATQGQTHSPRAPNERRVAWRD